MSTALRAGAALAMTAALGRLGALFGWLFERLGGAPSVALRRS